MAATECFSDRAAQPQLGSDVRPLVRTTFHQGTLSARQRLESARELLPSPIPSLRIDPSRSCAEDPHKGETTRRSV